MLLSTTEDMPREVMDVKDVSEKALAESDDDMAVESSRVESSRVDLLQPKVVVVVADAVPPYKSVACCGAW
jgi:hypothetical protein